MAAVFKILPTTQKYDWGKVGNDSAAARFASATPSSDDFSIQSDKPYAEVCLQLSLSLAYLKTSAYNPIR